jgi:hypothetical protein
MRVIAMALLAALCGGCVTTETVQFRPTRAQEAIMRDGQAALVSKGKHSIVTVRPAGRQLAAGGRPVFLVGIQNMSRAPLDFRIGNVAARQAVGGNSVVELKVYSYDELADEERSAQVGRAIFAGVAGGLNAASASRHGYWAQTHAADQNAELAAQVAATGQQNMAALEAMVIKDHTLMPGEMYGGQLHLQPLASESSTPGKRYGIAMMIGPDRHEIEILQGSPQ